jgi:hypothetical protein
MSLVNKLMRWTREGPREDGSVMVIDNQVPPSKTTGWRIQCFRIEEQ